MPTFPNNRGLKSAALTKMKALPAAAATNYSDSIDLAGDPATHGVQMNGFLRIYLPATPSLVDAKTVTLTLQDSADDSTFTAVTGIATVVATGASSAGAAAIDREVQIPTTLRRYVRLKQDVLTAGGDNTAISTTLEFIFKG